MQIAGLHCHSEYSPLDGFCSTEEMMQQAVEIGMPAISITDHGTLAGHRSFQRDAKKHGIKPILGEELYYSETDRFDRRAKTSRQDGTSVYVHLIALAMNDKGLQNLQAIDREAWIAYYNKPRMDFELLEQYGEDIIFTSACMGGLLSKAINERQDFTYAYEQATKFKDLLGDRYYIELQGHNPTQLNYDLLELADQLKIKAIVAEDSHYASEKQRVMEEIFLILSTHPKMIKDVDVSKASELELMEYLDYLYPDEVQRNGKRRMSFRDINLFIGGYDLRKREFVEIGIDREDIFENTLEIAGRIGDYTYQEGLDTLPTVSDNPDKELREKVYIGLKKLKLDDKPEYVAAAEHELSVISEKGFPTYFLILEDAVSWANRQGIRSGFGRGSAAGSLTCYATGITGLDPLKNHLLFERFLDPEREDMPDVDWDIQDDRRGEVKQYLADKYGHVASITNINRYKGKKALKDAARALGVSYAVVNKAIKSIEGIDEVTGHDVIAEFREAAKVFCKKYPLVPDIAEQLFGRINGYGMHAAGVVVTDRPIADYAPIETRKVTGSDDRIEVVALDKGECESLGLVKIDLLGLKTLTVIEDAIQLVKKNRGRVIDLQLIDYDDPDVYDMISKGKTLGVFQCEATPYTKLLVQMGCKDFNDLSVSNALVRPGAWNAIGKDYISAKHGINKGIQIHDDVSGFMDETFGYPVYQEQMMKLSVELAGFTVGESNALRRGIGKKKREIIDTFKPKFVMGASSKVSKEVAERLWISFEESGAYAFNKSHAVAYSMLSYQTAWLKYHYPLEFMCALLMNEDKKEKVTDYLLECKAMGIRVRFPHINHSDVNFSIEEDGLRMGLAGIKYISDTVANRIIEKRPFDSYVDFRDYVLKKGSGLNTRVLSALNSFGGAQFKDNPRPEDFKKNLYEYLGIPAFDTNMVTQRMKDHMYTLIEYTDDETFICMGMVKNVKRGEGWARVDMVDATATAGAFADQNIDVVKGKMYVFLIGNNRIMKFVDLDQVNESDDVILDYLRRPELTEIVEGQYKILHAQARKTKTGKNIANVVVCGADKKLETLMVFEKNLGMVRMVCKIGSVRALDIKEYKGTRFINGAS
jgi:DNA polymerase III subunit alpha